MSYIVETKFNGLPWTAASAPNEPVPIFHSMAKAQEYIDFVKSDPSFDDPTWKIAEYRIRKTKKPVITKER